MFRDSGHVHPAEVTGQATVYTLVE
jgi:hypothetical protein